MKFLCDNCKAKYQIADEKVAGKTVRMKCRKCGHQIEVRAAITETSVTGAPPVDPDVRAQTPRGALATSLSATKPRPASQPGPQPTGGALAGAFQRTVQDAPSASQFPSNAPAASVEMSVTDEWYVAINGVPVGPVRISELRRKAATGAVTEDSLCWQEGLEEWRPVRSLPELAAIVREAAQGNRPSLLAPPPPEPPKAQQPAPPRPPPARPAPLAPRTPEPLRTSEPPRPAPGMGGAPLAPSRSNVVPLHGPRVAASADEMPATSPLGGAAAALAPAPLNPPPPAPVMAVADPFALPPPAAAPMSPSMSPSMGSGVSIVPAPAMSVAATPSMAPAAPAPARRGAPLWFWPVLVFAGVFAAGTVYYVFKGQPAPAPVVIQVPTPTAPTTTAAKTDDVPPPASAEPVTSSSAPTPTTTAKVATNGGTKTTSTAPTATSKTADLSGLLGGAGGPNVGPGGSSGGGAGGTMDAATVQRIVRDRSPGVKRTCWDRGGDQKSSAKVTVAITVGPNGHVDNASASGDDPVITKCIENQVRGWQFPATGSTTTVNVPFVFVRQ